MFVRLAIASGFLFHAVLGGLCLMPVVSAKEMPMAHREHREMAMTPIVPMTPADCDGCISIKLSQPEPMQAMGCSDGHCFKQASATVASVSSSEREILSTLSLSKAYLLLDVAPQRKSYISAMAPPAAILTENIVLRL